MALSTKTKLILCLMVFSCQEAEHNEVIQAPHLTQQESNEDCAQVPWNYNNVGAPFMRTWCTSCHHGDLPEGERADAPSTINLDTYSDVITHLERISARSLSDPPTMPPAGGVPEEELQRLREWIICGAPQ